MKKEKVPKIKKIKQKKAISFSDIFFFILSLALTLIVFVGLIVAENYLSGETTYVNVVTAKTDIPKSVVITDENLSQYFALKDVDSKNDVDGSLTDMNVLLGLQTECPLVPGEIVLLKDFSDTKEYLKNLEHPVQIAIATNTLSDIAGGVLREGDLVNIVIVYNSKYAVGTSDGFREDVEDNEKTEGTINSQLPFFATHLLENVYVSAVMDSSGVVIDSADRDSNASILLLTVEESDELVISNALANGNQVRISKVLH